MRLSIKVLFVMISVTSQLALSAPPNYPHLDQFKSIVGQEHAVAKFFVVYYNERLEKYRGNVCASAFIATDKLLSAAHCLDRDNIVRKEIIMDNKQIQNVTQLDWLKKSEGFPAYNYSFYTKLKMDVAENDLVLITLKSAFKNQQPFYDLFKEAPTTLIGKTVKIIGYPRIYQNLKDPYDNSNKFSTGFVCKIIDFHNEVLYSDCLPQQGLSGGPVVYTDEKGKEWLIGILSSFSRSSVERYGSKITP